MARIDPDELREPERVFIAATLRLALQAEELLTTNGVDYAVQVEEYARSFLFGTARNAAVFYVASGQAAYCRTQLTSAGLGKGVIEIQQSPE
jgi:hypothetical protein